MSEEVESMFLHERVILYLPDGTLECFIEDVITELGEFYFYVCRLESGGVYYQSVDSVLGIEIKTTLKKI